jgi:hypothetical protein
VASAPLHRDVILYRSATGQSASLSDCDQQAGITS